MSKIESMIIKLIIGIVCPFCMLVIFFWLTGAFNIYVATLSNSVNIAATFSGLLAGCVLDYFFLHRWAANFYMASQRAVIAVYIFLFLFSFGFFMGFPVGTFTLGIAAGLYTGRRGYHHQMNETLFTSDLRKVAFYTALATFIADLPVGILGINEPVVATLFRFLFGLDKTAIQGVIGYMLVVLFCFSLFIMQYWGIRIIGQWGFHAGKKIQEI